MVSINLTLLVELGLFLLFLTVTNRFIFRPLLRIMDEREAAVTQDKQAAQSGQEEARRLETLHADKALEARKLTAARLREARDEAYRHNREELEQLRQTADSELTTFRAKVVAQLESERAKCNDLLPSVVDAIDRQLHAEGSIL